MPAARRTFTRAQLTAALDAIDRPDLAERMYALRLDFSDGGGTALGVDFSDWRDLGLFLVTVATMLGPSAGEDFASALQVGLPAYPDGGDGHHGAYWPGFVLDEPTWEQWTDELAGCLTCRALDDDGPCTPHATGPWQRRPTLVP